MSRTPASQDREWGSGAPVAAGSQCQRQPLGVPLQRAGLDGRIGELQCGTHEQRKRKLTTAIHRIRVEVGRGLELAK